MISVALDPTTVRSLEKTKFEASLLRSKVTFVEKKFKITYVNTINKGRKFKTVLNKNNKQGRCFLVIFIGFIFSSQFSLHYLLYLLCHLSNRGGLILVKLFFLYRKYLHSVFKFNSRE